MYEIWADNLKIYDDTIDLIEYKVTDPTLTLEDNSSGSLKMTIPSTNIGYDTVKRMTSHITVIRNGFEIWAGRVLTEEADFWNNRILTCEGELAYFNDTSQPVAEYTNVSIATYLKALIAKHNLKVDASRQFDIDDGQQITVTGTIEKIYTNYEKTVDCLGKLIEQYGGHFRIRKTGNKRYLDYLANYVRTNPQKIDFGKNLLDFTRNWDESNFATVVIPLGAKLEEQLYEDIDERLTIRTVNSGKDYLESSVVSTYGRIEKVVTWDDEESPQNLKAKGQQYLSEIQFDNMTIELSALDLHYLDVNVEAINLLDVVLVTSQPHGMIDHAFPVTKLDIPLDRPENTKFTLNGTAISSLSSLILANTIKTEETINASSQSTYKKSSINTTKVVNKATNGYITITRETVQNPDGTDSLYITDTSNLSSALKMWKWDLNGLSYSTRSSSSVPWSSPLVAMNMDGSIVADRITTGTLKSQNNNFSLNLNDGTLTMKKGSINIGNDAFKVDTDGSVTITKGSLSIGANDNFKVTSTGQVTIKDGSIDINSGTFSVTTDGRVTATNGYIGGFSIYNGYLMGDGLTIRPTGEIQFILYEDEGETVEYLGAITPRATGIGAGNGYFSHDEARGPISRVWEDGDIIAWIGDDNGSAIDNLKLTYVKNAPLWDPDNPEYTKYQVANRIYFGCDIDGDDHTAYNLRLDPNTSGAFGVNLSRSVIAGGEKISFLHGFGIMSEDVDPMNHRNTLRGQSLGSSVSTDQQKRIWNGTFLDMYIGDYWTINGVKWVIVDFDYWYNTAGTAFTKHHVVVMPETNLYNAKMNDTNVNDTGYAGSKMFTTNLNNAKTTVNSAFPNLVLTRADYLVKTVNSSGLNSAADWYNCTVDIPSETMIYGSKLLGNQNATSLAFFGINYRQLAFFRLNPKLVTRSAMWLRDPVSTNRFCALSATGAVASYGSSGEYGVRPIFAMGPSSAPS